MTAFFLMSVFFIVPLRGRKVSSQLYRQHGEFIHPFLIGNLLKTDQLIYLLLERHGEFWLVQRKTFQYRLRGGIGGSNGGIESSLAEVELWGLLARNSP